MKYENSESSWKTIGGAVAGGRLDLAIDSTGVPYLAYYSRGLNIAIYNGAEWEISNYPNTTGHRIILAIDSLGVLYIANWNNDQSAQVFKAQFVVENAAKPTINTQPAGATVYVGGTSPNMTVQATSTDGGTLSYQWYSNTTNSNSGGSLVNGATGTTFNAPTSTAGTTYYYVVVTNTNNVVNVKKTATTTSNAVAVTVNESPWEVVGTEGIIDGYVQKTSLIFDRNGAPYVAVAYADSTAVVLKYDKSEGWSNVGDTYFPTATASFISLALDSNDVPYFAYQDEEEGQYYGRVVKFEDGGWVPVGGLDGVFTNGEAFDINLVISEYNDLYVAYRGSNDMINVKRLKGGNWDSQGKRDFASGEYLSLALKPNGGPYVAFMDSANQYKATVLKYNEDDFEDDGTGWLPVGKVGASFKKAEYTSLAFNDEGDPYVAFIDDNKEDKVTVIKFSDDLQRWAYVYDTGFSAGAAFDVSLAFYNNVPYVAYKDLGNYGKATVMYPGSTGWIPLGNEGFSNGTPSLGTLSFAINTNGVPYVAYGDGANGNGLAVMRIKTAPETQVDAATPTIDTQPVGKSVNEGGNAILSVSASVSDEGTLSYQWHSNTTNSNSGGTPINGATSATFKAPTSTIGTTYYYVVVTNINNSVTGAKTAEVTSNAVAVIVTAANNNNQPPVDNTPNEPVTPPTTPPTTPPVTPPASTGVDVLVNGKVENAGTASTKTENGKTITTITVDQKKIDEKLAAEGLGATITIPVNTNSDIVVGELNGQMVKNMEDQQATVEIKTDSASYTLPAGQININSIAQQIGTNIALQDIKIQIEIATPTADAVQVVENSAKTGEFTIIAPPLEFTVRATHGDQTVEVTDFNSYVSRMIAIPDGVDPNKITTGVVVDPNGTVRHVPTQVIIIDGRYFAKINSLTNSLYSVVWHPIEFADVENHWAKKAVNDMGSRTVVSGIGNGLFNPDAQITRAEFAAIVVRSLGLRLDNVATSFTDVKATDWYNSAVKTAFDYNLINGYVDGTFRPNDQITREQAMAIIARAMQITGLKAKLPAMNADQQLSSFEDVNQISAWAFANVADCVQAAIVSGKNDNKMAPKDNITRAEVATIVQRLLQKSELINQ